MSGQDRFNNCWAGISQLHCLWLAFCQPALLHSDRYWEQPAHEAKWGPSGESNEMIVQQDLIVLPSSSCSVVARNLCIPVRDNARVLV